MQSSLFVGLNVHKSTISVAIARGGRCSLLDDGCYLGVWDSVADYAQDLTEETTEIPDHLQYYINYSAMARDIELNGDIFTVELDGHVHIFANH